MVIEPSPNQEVTWTIASGDGSIIKTSSNTATLNAGAFPSDRLAVRAKFGPVTLNVDFTVKAPSGGFVKKDPTTQVYHYGAGYSSVGYIGILHLLPNDVSFYNIEFREGGGTLTATGYYANVPGLDGLEHPIGQWFPVFPNNEVDSRDIINSGAYSGPFEFGVVQWPINWEYRVGSSAARPFTVITHSQMSDETKATIIKGNTALGSDGPFFQKSRRSTCRIWYCSMKTTFNLTTWLVVIVLMNPWAVDLKAAEEHDVTKHDYSKQLATFNQQLSPANFDIDECIGIFRDIQDGGAAWKARLSENKRLELQQVERSLVIKMMVLTEKALARPFDRNNRPLNHVLPPIESGFQHPVDPQKIEDPKLRETYKAQIAANRRKICQ